MKDEYQYTAIVKSVYDGDTCTVDIDLGLGVWIRNEKIRLKDINAPEIRGEEREKGIQARNFLRSIIAGKRVLLYTFKNKKGKYGRYIAEVLILHDKKWISINKLLVEKGFSIYKKY